MLDGKMAEETPAEFRLPSLFRIDLADGTPRGVMRVIFEPIVWTIRQPPIRVPRPIAAWQASTTQKGT